jgi:hypothetical protein
VNGLLAVGALLLAGAGAAKVAKPRNTALAMGLAPSVIRAGAAAELMVGLGALVSAAPVTAILVGASYVGFAIYVGGSLLRHAPLSTCACFGEDDTPATALHVIVDLTLAGGAGLAAAGRPEALGFPAILVAGVTAYLCFLALTALPRTLAAARR